MKDSDRADRSRWPMLDGLRGIAILLVLASHVGLGGNGGAVGVTLFFVLSGFLITNLLVGELDSEGSIRLGRFYFRRADRLLPALVLYLVGAGLVAIAFGRSWGWVWNETWPPLLYVANYSQILGAELDMNWQTWSLAVEEHFYLIWPLLLLLIPTRRRLRLLGAGVLVLAVWSGFTWFLDSDWGYSSTDANAYALAAGCLVAVARRERAAPRFPPSAPLLGVVLLAAATAIAAHPIRQPIVVAIAALTVWACVAGEVGVLGSRPLRFVGRISYGLYLWHVPVLMAAGSALGSRALAAVASVGVAWMSWIVVERPLLIRREDHWNRLIARRRRHDIEGDAATGPGIPEVSSPAVL